MQPTSFFLTVDSGLLRCDDHNDDDDDDDCHNYYDGKAESDDVDDYDDAKGF